MSPISRCPLECPAITAERVLYRHDQLQSHDTLRLIAVARLGIMGTTLAAHAAFTCSQRRHLEDWQPSAFCDQRARAIMASRPFSWIKLTEHEQEVLAPYRTDESR